MGDEDFDFQGGDAGASATFPHEIIEKRGNEKFAGGRTLDHLGFVIHTTSTSLRLMPQCDGRWHSGTRTDRFTDGRLILHTRGRI